MTEKRVCFDFEAEFSNGGGIQGQDFRLDIDGDDISDSELSSYIIRDLRLLMVGRIRILHKKIIEEQHKRNVVPALPEEASQTMNFVDLSHTIDSGMITYKGLPAPLICDHMSHAQSRSTYAEGTEFQIGRIDMVANTGTYLDTPYHRYPHGDDLSVVPLRVMSNLPGVVIRVTGAKERAIDWSMLAAANVWDRAVLVHTGWDRHWRTDQYFEDHPFLTKSAAEYLRDKGAILVGIDSLNIDDTRDLYRPVHSVLLGSGIPIVEHLTMLQDLPDEGFQFFAVPPKVSRMGTFPVRAHATVNSMTQAHEPAE